MHALHVSYVYKVSIEEQERILDFNWKLDLNQKTKI